MRSRLLSITSYGDGAHYIGFLWPWGHVVRRMSLPAIRRMNHNAAIYRPGHDELGQLCAFGLGELAGHLTQPSCNRRFASMYAACALSGV